MILKQERIIPEIRRKAPEIGVPYKGVDAREPSRFYKCDPSLNQAVVGYQKGPKNSYLEKLMQM